MWNSFPFKLRHQPLKKNQKPILKFTFGVTLLIVIICRIISDSLEKRNDKLYKSIYYGGSLLFVNHIQIIRPLLGRRIAMLGLFFMS